MLAEKLLSCLESGKASLQLDIDGRNALNAEMSGKDIKVDIKDASFAAEAALQLAGDGMNSIAALKKAGFRIKVKLGLAEFEI
ncbi:MAG: hypothetical protein HYX24_05490 [Candidatus Aenigmarchaeota archaeon]|nr:hypothetical protein [Candidatus Aenigmarchaeota archaeon]